MLNYVKKLSPDIIIMQEYTINSKDAKLFKREMEVNGYVLESEETTPRSRPSMTIFFVRKSTIPAHTYVYTGHKLNARAYSIKVDDIIIYGTHVPLNSKTRPTIREDYWDEIIAFYKKHKDNKLILLGDFNTYDESSEAYKRYLKLLDCGAYDLWLRQGKSKSTQTELKYRNRLDYIFISPSVEDNVVLMDIDLNTMYQDKISDHAALILELK